MAAMMTADTTPRRIVRAGRGRAAADCCAVPRPGPIPGAVSSPGDVMAAADGSAMVFTGSGRRWRGPATAPQSSKWSSPPSDMTRTRGSPVPGDDDGALWSPAARQRRPTCGGQGTIDAVMLLRAPARTHKKSGSRAAPAVFTGGLPGSGATFFTIRSVGPGEQGVRRSGEDLFRSPGAGRWSLICHKILEKIC
jgi:hypothetical protein